jgi:hypothetical protein
MAAELTEYALILFLSILACATASLRLHYGHNIIGYDRVFKKDFLGIKSPQDYVLFSYYIREVIQC